MNQNTATKLPSFCNNQPGTPQRIESVTLNQVQALCSNISDWVHRDCGFVGLPALSLQRDLFNGLYLILLERRTDAVALEFVQNRKLSMIEELERIEANQPDLLEITEKGSKKICRLALGKMLDEAHDAGLI